MWFFGECYPYHLGAVIDNYWSFGANLEIDGEEIFLRTFSSSTVVSGVPRLFDLGSGGSEGKRFCLE